MDKREIMVAILCTLDPYQLKEGEFINAIPNAAECADAIIEATPECDSVEVTNDRWGAILMEEMNALEDALATIQGDELDPTRTRFKSVLVRLDSLYKEMINHV